MHARSVSDLRNFKSRMTTLRDPRSILERNNHFNFPDWNCEWIDVSIGRAFRAWSSRYENSIRENSRVAELSESKKIALRCSNAGIDLCARLRQYRDSG